MRDQLLAAFQIGREDCNQVRVEVVETSGDFITVEVHAAAGAFAGAFRTDIVGAGLLRFRDDLRVLYERLSGTATFTGDYERMLQIEVTGDGRGHMTAACRVTDCQAFGARLQFSIDFDQTEMPAMLAGFDSVLATLGGFQAS
jgi:hypothetical protein